MLLGVQILALALCSLMLWRISIYLDQVDRRLERALTPPESLLLDRECDGETWPDIEERCLERIDTTR